MIMDRRIITKNYGRVFLRSIPPFRVASEDQIMDFVMEHCASCGVSSVGNAKEVSNDGEVL